MPVTYSKPIQEVCQKENEELKLKFSLPVTCWWSSFSIWTALGCYAKGHKHIRQGQKTGVSKFQLDHRTCNSSVHGEKQMLLWVTQICKTPTNKLSRAFLQVSTQLSQDVLFQFRNSRKSFPAFPTFMPDVQWGVGEEQHLFVPHILTWSVFLAFSCPLWTYWIVLRLLGFHSSWVLEREENFTHEVAFVTNSLKAWYSRKLDKSEKY